ncbi:hypothetical protein H6503_00020 [Candidatus Woesearchaeota archaeon]|nr:hypothetical protein [Candidatus Woesearchaeota archaeon]
MPLKPEEMDNVNLSALEYLQGFVIPMTDVIDGKVDLFRTVGTDGAYINFSRQYSDRMSAIVMIHSGILSYEIGDGLQPMNVERFTYPSDFYNSMNGIGKGPEADELLKLDDWVKALHHIASAFIETPGEDIDLNDIIHSASNFFPYSKDTRQKLQEFSNLMPRNLINGEHFVVNYLIQLDDMVREAVSKAVPRYVVPIHHRVSASYF